MAQKGLVDPHLEIMLQHFTKSKKESYSKRTTNDAVPWFRPPLEGWDGDLQTEEGLITIHDVQIDYAAQAERAFRARTTQTFPRALAHLSTREKGHGQDTGAFTGQALNYFTAIIKQGSEGKGGAI
jgi:hypothetical protein